MQCNAENTNNFNAKNKMQVRLAQLAIPLNLDKIATATPAFSNECMSVLRPKTKC